MTPEQYIAKAREHLEKHEWTKYHYCTACDCCGNHKHIGHKDNCERANLIHVFVEVPNFDAELADLDEMASAGSITSDWCAEVAASIREKL